MLNQLWSVHAVWASLVLIMSAPEGTAFEPSDDIPGDLRASPSTPLGFTLSTLPLTKGLTCSELGHLGMPQPGMSAYEP